MIHTITFFAVSCSENSAFFRKNRQIFEKIPRKTLTFFEKIGHEKNAAFVVFEIPKKFGSIWRQFSKNLAKFAKIKFGKTAKNSAIVNENFEIEERCKGVHCVDLGESFSNSS